MADERNTPFNQVFPNLVQLTDEGLLETGDGRPDPQQMLDEKVSLTTGGGIEVNQVDIRNATFRSRSSNVFHSFDVAGSGIDSGKVIFNVSRQTGGSGSDTYSALGGVMTLAMGGRSAAASPAIQICSRQVIIGATGVGDGTLEVNTSELQRVRIRTVPEMSFDVQLVNATDTSADVMITVTGTFANLNWSARFVGVSTSRSSARLLKIEQV